VLPPDKYIAQVLSELGLTLELSEVWNLVDRMELVAAGDDMEPEGVAGRSARVRIKDFLCVRERERDRERERNPPCWSGGSQAKR
jgi:hypothetical protein